MQGRVYRRGTGWAFKVDLPRDPATGQRRQRQKGGFATRKAAEDGLTDLLGEIRKDMVAGTGTTKLDDWLDEWLAAVQPALRPSTYSLYSTAVTSWITPRIGALKLAEVTPQVVQRLYNDLATSGGRNGKGLGPRSVRLAHQVLQQAFAKAVEWRVTPTNPLVAGIILPRMEPKEMKTLSAEDAKAFLHATADDRLGPLWCLLLTTGLRRGEALGLRWIDVDLEDAWLEVRQAVVAVKGTPMLSEPKTKTGRRTVYLSGRSIEALKDQRTRQDADRKLVGSAWEASGLVFTTTTGGLLHPRNVLRDFQSALDRAKLPRVRLHDLRHTVATLLLHEGAHPKVVQELLGHANVAITLNTYSHATPGLHREAADMLEGVLKL